MPASPSVTCAGDVDEVIATIRSVLTDDLLKPQFRRLPNRKPSAGHCYAASEALYHLLGGKGAGLTPVRLRHEGLPHWYLRTAAGVHLDPTADQFTTLPPHAEGTGGGFLTRQPSKRAAEIIRRVNAA